MSFASFYSFEDFSEIAYRYWWRDSVLERKFKEINGPGASTLENAQKLTAEQRDLLKAAREENAKDSEAITQHEKSNFEPKFMNFLESLRCSGKLSLIPGVKGRKINFATNWNLFIEKGLESLDQYQKRDIGHTFKNLFITRILVDRGRKKDEPYNVRDGVVSPERALIMYNQLVLNIDSGSVDDIYSSQEEYDFISGKRCKLAMDDWFISFVTFNMKLRDYEPILDIEDMQIETVEINVPSGRLMISDWFRIQGFNEATDRNYEEDINCATGAIACSKRYAASDIIHIQTTNTYVGIEENPSGKLGIIESWTIESETTGKRFKVNSESKGQVSCDLWWITALDRDVLIAKLAEGGNPDPEGALETYLASKDAYASNIVEVAVKPGRWRAHFGVKQASDKEGFLVKGKAFGFNNRPKFWAVLEPVDSE